MNVRVLALLLRPGPGQGGVIALPMIAFALVTAIVLVVMGGAQAFWGWTDPEASIYHALAAIALVLLVVPLVSLGGAAARLSARRRDERLSTLRLMGVSPGGVITATVVESTLIAAAGALAGIVLYIACVPLLGLIPFRGTPLGLTAVLLTPLAIAGIAASMIALAGVSAVIGLRLVVISPLGVRTRAAVPRVHWVRAVGAIAVIALAFATMMWFPGTTGVIVTIIVVAGMFAAALAVLNLVGPWALKVHARRGLRRAEQASRLLAMRFILESPKAAWRQVSGVAMASFMAVFAGAGVAMVDTASAAAADDATLVLIGDIRTGLIITLVASFVMVAVSVGVNQASAIIDQRELHRSLHFFGVPLEVVDSARTRAVMAPLLVTAICSALCAAVLVLPLIGLALIVQPISIVTILAVLVAGVGIVWLSTRLTRPLLARAFAPA
ncbi:permease [Microbacterium sp.]|uniref:permease n=1 Tax=Microbacterium sp. TaxID=51671 RepID=UPI003A904F46